MQLKTFSHFLDKETDYTFISVDGPASDVWLHPPCWDGLSFHLDWCIQYIFKGPSYFIVFLTFLFLVSRQIKMQNDEALAERSFWTVTYAKYLLQDYI